MPKKRSATKKKSPKSSSRLKTRDIKLEKALIDNFIALQKVMANLSVKFDNLSSQISKLLELFEISAKSLADRNFKLESPSKETKKISEKIDKLLDQNKIIARGLTLMHEPKYPSEPVQDKSSVEYQEQSITHPKSEEEPPTPLKENSMEGYQKSISSPVKRFRPLPKK